jgi:prophage antirepressor-like protein
MSNLTLSLSWEGRPVRVVGTPEAPEWVAADVCSVLGIVNNRDALRRVPIAERGVVLTDTPGGPQKLVTVRLSGLLRLILRSDKPEAQRFQTWTVTEVLPSVLKHGCYPPPAAAAGTSAIAVAEAALSGGQALLAVAKDHEARLAAIEAAQAEGRRTIAALPDADGHVDEATYGAMTEKRIRSYARVRSLEYSYVYREFYDAADVRIHVRLGREYRTQKLLRDAIDSYAADKAKAIYNLACEMFPSDRQKAA